MHNSFLGVARASGDRHIWDFGSYSLSLSLEKFVRFFLRCPLSQLILEGPLLMPLFFIFLTPSSSLHAPWLCQLRARCRHFSVSRLPLLQ